MAHYLVRARPKEDRLGELGTLLAEDAFLGLRPFGRAVTHSLRNARLGTNGGAVWEEEDYCSPPLAQERRAVLDEYFEDLSVTPVSRGEGWKCIESLPPLFPGLAVRAPRGPQGGSGGSERAEGAPWAQENRSTSAPVPQRAARGRRTDQDEC